MQIATGTEQKAKMLKNENWRTFFVAVVLILNQIKRHMLCIHYILFPIHISRKILVRPTTEDPK